MCRAGRAQAKQRWSTLALARRMKSPSLQGWRPLAEASGVEAEAEPEAVEAEAEAEAAEAEATRCGLEEESEMAALYGDVPNQLRVLGWTPAAEAGFEVVVLLHGWAAAVHDGVQVRAVCARDGGAHAMHLPCTCSHACSCRCAGSSSRWRAFPRTSSRSCTDGRAARWVRCARPSLARAAPSSAAVGRSVA